MEKRTRLVAASRKDRNTLAKTDQKNGLTREKEKQ